MKSNEKKPSEIIEESISILESGKEDYERAKKKCEEWDSLDRFIYWAHKFEFAKDRAERNRLATAFQRERRERRRFKDIQDKYKAIHDFVCSDNNKSTLKRMKGMIGAQRKQEKYLESERQYKGGDKSDNSI